MRHDVAPMARGIADREQNRFVGSLRLRKRVGSPRPPVDRIVLMLQQIRRCLAGEAVFVERGPGRGPSQTKPRTGITQNPKKPAWMWRPLQISLGPAPNLGAVQSTRHTNV